MRCFVGQPWAGTLEEKKARNRSIVRANKLSTLLFRNPAGLISGFESAQPISIRGSVPKGRRFVGFSMAIPITQFGYTIYFGRSAVFDNAFSADLIAKSDALGGKPESAEAIVLFASAIDRAFLKGYDKKYVQHSEDYLKFLAVGVIAQLHDLVAEHFPNRAAKIYVQNNSITIGRFLRRLGFKRDTRLKTADREAVYVA